jgi:hypothetical protein
MALGTAKRRSFLENITDQDKNFNFKTLQIFKLFSKFSKESFTNRNFILKLDRF